MKTFRAIAAARADELTREASPGHPLRGIGCGYFGKDFLQEVERRGHSPSEAVYAIEPLIRAKGAKVVCPRDGRLGSSYVDAVTGDGAGKAECMLSYSWGYAVGDIAETLNRFGSSNTYIWICCLCINQHRVKEAQSAGKVVPFEEFKEAFGKRVAGVTHILAMMSPWHCPFYIKRAWCVFEFSCAMTEGKQLTVLMPPAEEEAFRAALFKGGVQSLFDGLAALRIQDAASSVAEDKLNILRTIDPDAQDINASLKVEALNMSVKKKLQAWFVEATATWLELEIADGSKACGVEQDVYNSIGEMLLEVVADCGRAKRVVEAGIAWHGAVARPGAAALRMLGRIAARQCKWKRSLEIYTEAMKLLDACGSSHSLQSARLLVDMSAITKGNKQLDLLKMAKRTYEDFGAKDLEDYARLLKHMGTLMVKSAELDQAFDFFEQARQCYLQLKLELSPGYADLLVNLGRLQAAQSHLQNGLETFQEAMRVYQAIGVTSGRGYSVLLRDMARLHSHMGHDVAARDAFNEAEQIYKSTSMLDAAKVAPEWVLWKLKDALVYPFALQVDLWVAALCFFWRRKSFTTSIARALAVVSSYCGAVLLFKLFSIVARLCVSMPAVAFGVALFMFILVHCVWSTSHEDSFSAYFSRFPTF